MKSFRIGSRVVGGDAPVFIIAELSANHGQNRDVALRTIEAAAKVGADAIKLQTYTPDTLTLKSDAPLFVVKVKNEWAGRTLYDLYAEAMTPWEWHAELFAAAREHGLECFSTPFDHTAVAFLETLKAPCHKVASFELNDLPLVEAIARTGKPMILSTGMASLADIEAALSTCRSAGNDNLALLRCVSSYPARPETMDLRSLDVLRSLGVVLGLSDHTVDITVPVAAVALGVKVIEKHFIMDRSIGGPDAFFSLDPAQFREMVRAVRSTEAALGKPRFGPSDDERASTAFRRSLFVSGNVRKGETLTSANVRSVRPVNGLHPRHLPEVLGRRATRDLEAATPLAWNMIGERPEVPALTLRLATGDDGPLLLAWRNDEETRAMSLTTTPVTEEQHAAFLARSIGAADRKLFVAEEPATKKPVGTLRLDSSEHDRDRGTLEVSLTVAPGDRGRGYGQALLLACEEEARKLGAIRLVAVLRADNLPSRKAFEAAGYYGFTNEVAEGGARLVHCERRLVAFV
jgi:pseudaminic acid synthase